MNQVLWRKYSEWPMLAAAILFLATYSVQVIANLGGMTAVPLTRRPGGLQAFRMVLAGDARGAEPDPRVHEGYEWVYVLNGRLRRVLGDKDFELRPGEAAEFDTHTPHWFASADGRPVEFISPFGQQGERMHVRSRPKPP